MIRPFVTSPALRNGLPRTRGDDPAAPDTLIAVVAFAPHARG